MKPPLWERATFCVTGALAHLVPLRVYRVPNTERSRLDQTLGDDVLSRQSLTIRDGRHFGLPGNETILFVEGTEQGVFRADELLASFAKRAEDEPGLLRQLKAEEDDAASGLGSIFG